MNAYHPQKTLARGFALVYDANHRLIKQSESVALGDSLSIHLASGTLNTVVTGKEQP